MVTAYAKDSWELQSYHIECREHDALARYTIGLIQWRKIPDSRRTGNLEHFNTGYYAEAATSQRYHPIIYDTEQCCWVEHKRAVLQSHKASPGQFELQHSSHRCTTGGRARMSGQGSNSQRNPSTAIFRITTLLPHLLSNKGNKQANGHLIYHFQKPRTNCSALP